MAKKRDEAGNSDGMPQQREATESNAPGDESHRAGGRTIARWKQAVFAEMPEGTDQQIADRINQIAREEGYDYSCSADAVARWRQPELTPSPTRQTPPQPEEEGHAYVVLRQLVYLLGKDAVKKLIDSL
jgi:hypothetical protein